MSAKRVAGKFLGSFSFKGRITRAEYWAITFFFNIILIAGLVGVSAAEQGNEIVATIFLGVFFLFILPSFFIGLATWAKRFHDTNHSALWLLTGFIGIFGIIPFIYLGFAPGTAGPNLYGPDPKRVSNEEKEKEVGRGKKIDPIGAFYKSVELLKKENAEEALSILEEALESNPNREIEGAIYYNAAIAHRRLGNHEKTKEYLAKAIHDRPKLYKQAHKDSELADMFNDNDFTTFLKEAKKS